VLGITKTLNCTVDYALYEISYQNALMYARAMPMYDDEKEESSNPLYDDSKDACNPDNFNDFEDEIIVRR